MSQTLYISGVPGIGKTACVFEVAKKMSEEVIGNKFKFIYVNALKLKQPSFYFKDLFQKITGIKETHKHSLSYLERFFKTGKLPKHITKSLTKKELEETQKVLIICIDEVDYLYTKNQEIIYNIFDWAHYKKARIATLCIANTIDFPERLMPKIVSRMGNRRLTFKTYTGKQIEEIVAERLKTISLFE